eukprot:4667278-Amphidinium_carterae.1
MRVSMKHNTLNLKHKKSDCSRNNKEANTHRIRKESNKCNYMRCSHSASGRVSVGDNLGGVMNSCLSTSLHWRCGAMTHSARQSLTNQSQDESKGYSCTKPLPFRNVRSTYKDLSCTNFVRTCVGILSEGWDDLRVDVQEVHSFNDILSQYPTNVDEYVEFNVQLNKIETCLPALEKRYMDVQDVPRSHFHTLGGDLVQHCENLSLSVLLLLLMLLGW